MQLNPLHDKDSDNLSEKMFNLFNEHNMAY